MGRFCTDLATPGPHYHDLGPIFPMLVQGWFLYGARYANIPNVGPRLVQTSQRPVCSATTTGQYSPLRCIVLNVEIPGLERKIERSSD